MYVHLFTCVDVYVQCKFNVSCSWLNAPGCYTEAGARRVEAAFSRDRVRRVKGVLLDVTQDESVRACLDLVRLELQQKGATFWACVNNAGTHTNKCYIYTYICIYIYII